MGAPQNKSTGSSASGFSNNFMSILSSLLGGVGGMSAAGAQGGSNPFGQTGTGATGILSNILSPGAGNLGGALGQMLKTSNMNNVNALRANYGSSGGTSQGTPAASAEATYRAQEAPQQALGVGNLQLGAISNILGLSSGIAQKGIAQNVNYTTPSELSQVLSMLGGGASGAGSLLSGLGMGGGAAGVGAAPALDPGLLTALAGL